MCENRSLWQINSDIPTFDSLEGDKEVDVLIIGGGLAGILTAYFLHRQGVNYILTEKDRICGGITGNTTAKITFQHGLIYDKLLNVAGLEQTQMYLTANKKAFDMYLKLCKNIDCDLERQDNFVYSTDNRRKLEREVAALQKTGYEAFFYEHLPLPIKTVGGVCFKNQAQFHPLKFVKEISKGLNIYENTFIKEMVGNTAVYDGGRIKAKQVVVATHFPFINKHGNYFLKLYQHRSYVLALKWAEKPKGMFVDDDKKGLSFRSCGDLLLLGGGGHRTGKKGGGFEELQRFAAVNYPKAYSVGIWAAQDCMTLDNIPYIGRYSTKTQGLYTACGFNKWGMTSAMAAAMILCDTLLGSPPDYAKVFDPSRSILKPQLIVNGFEAVSNLITPTSKRCPHMGCALKWNNVEHTWDCPCHGSRFSKEGKVLDNPANGDIKTKPR